ncbi:site-specific integrase [Achromobacter xylosoxidans]
MMSGIQAIMAIASNGPNRKELTTVQAVRATNSRGVRGGISNMPIKAAIAAGMPKASAIFRAAQPPNPVDAGSMVTPLLSTVRIAAPVNITGAAMAHRMDKLKCGRHCRPFGAGAACMRPGIFPVYFPFLSVRPAMKPWTRRQPRRKPAPTLAEALARYLIEVSATKKGHTSEQSIARIWRATRLAIRPVDRIRSSDLTELRDEWLKDRAPATVVRRMAFLSHVYTVIRKDWGFDQLANPVQLVRRPAVDDARDRRLFDRITLRGLSEDDCPRKELEWIIRATRSAELPTILTVAKETGMRRSEVVGIQREHLDLMHGVVHLPHTKNGRARDVPLTPGPARPCAAGSQANRCEAASSQCNPARSPGHSFAPVAVPDRDTKACAGTMAGAPIPPTSATCDSMICDTKARRNLPPCSRSMNWPRSTATSTPACCCAITTRMGANWPRSWRAAS